MIKAFEMVRLGEADVKAKFPAMYNAFCYGAPPHAGIAPGVDRMVMLLAGEDSIRRDHSIPDEQECTGRHDGRSWVCNRTSTGRITYSNGN